MSAAAIADIIARLSASGSPFSLVEGATEFGTVSTERPLASPAAYVLTRNEAAGENERATGNVLQRVEKDIAIVIFTENLSDAAGAAAGSDLESLKDYCNARLVGFTPTDGHEPMEFISGELLAARGGGVWQEQLYALATYLEG